MNGIDRANARDRKRRKARYGMVQDRAIFVLAGLHSVGSIAGGVDEQPQHRCPHCGERQWEKQKKGSWRCGVCHHRLE